MAINVSMMKVWGKYYCGNRGDQEDYDVRPTLKELGECMADAARYYARENRKLPNPKKQPRSKESRLVRI